MSNEEVVLILEETAKLLELHNENPFKVKSYKNAAFKLDRFREPLSGKSPEELEKIEGIGKSLSHKIHDMLISGLSSDLVALREKTPSGILELLHIKGLGPRKVAQLWQELEIQSPGELLYACNENRLLELKGFGAKTQEQIRKSIEFSMKSRGYFLYAEAENTAKEFEALMLKLVGRDLLHPAGPYRRKAITLQHLDYVVTDDALSLILTYGDKFDKQGIKIGKKEDGWQSIETEQGIMIRLHPGGNLPLFLKQWIVTGTEEHCQDVESLTSPDTLKTANDEAGIYQLAGLPFIEPELREGLSEVSKAKEGKLPSRLVELSDLKGVIHNHTTYSDGINTLEEMAMACREMGYAYLAICDHSRSAVYAGGLSIEKVMQQHAEIDKLNEKLAPFRIFKGIESDILTDGSLDYPDDILALFDLVVASVHSGLRMDEEKATQRLLKAIQNPFTTILGHPSGRLLLSREAYPLDYPEIINACAEHNVAIELNAHPYRLDLDWKWIDYAVSKGVKVSINPDAHSIEGFGDLYYGVCAGRKGYLTAEHTLNALTLKEFTGWLETKKLKLTGNSFFS
jgi:DNA polymerase (family 10)